MSAVSRKTIPSSSARWIVAIDSASSVVPYHADMPMQPRPSSETPSPCPSVRVFIVGVWPTAAGLRGSAAIVGRRYGGPEEENVEGAPRQASRDPRDRCSEGERLSAV